PRREIGPLRRCRMEPGAANPVADDRRAKKAILNRFGLEVPMPLRQHSSYSPQTRPHPGPEATRRARQGSFESRRSAADQPRRRTKWLSELASAIGSSCTADALITGI